MRPARRDGQGPDRRRGLTAGADPRALHREVTELRFGVGRHEDLAERVDGLAARVEVLPDRLLLYTDDGEEALARVHGTGLDPAAVLVRRSTLEDVFLHLTGRTLVD